MDLRLSPHSAFFFFWGESVIKRLFALSFVVGLAIAGCGGGGGSTKSSVQTVSRTISLATSPTLDDGSHYASVNFVCLGSGPVAILVSSSALDPMVLVEKTNGDGTQEAVASDDDSGGGTSARATFNAVSGVSYTAYITSAGADAGGNVLVEYPSGKLAVTNN